MIKNRIESFEQSEKFKYFQYGKDYYIGDNTEIMKRRKCFYDESVGLLDTPYKANHKYPSGFFKIIVDQKVQYLLGNGVKTDEKVTEALDKATGGIYQTLIKAGTTASQQGLQWFFEYVDKGVLKFSRVRPEQVIPSYSKGVLVKITYFYEEERIVEGKLIKIQVAEEWTAENMIKYEKKEKDFEVVGSFSHYQNKETFLGVVVKKENHSFGRVPFICMKNNEYELSDLKDIKSLIDIYDLIASDFANNIDDMQDAFFIIKNFGGESLPEFLNQLKKFKSIQVGDDGDVQTKQLEIPVEARKTFIEMLNKDIFKFGMAVDTTAIAGGSLTNVAIQAAFSNLDLKCDKFEMQVTDFLNELLSAINDFYKTNLEADYKFDRSMIMNRTELLVELPKQVDMSLRSRLESNPLVNDVDVELEQLAKEEEEELQKLGSNMGFEEETDEEVD